jgi:Fur family ferric uptake transcriptional regulator
VRQEAVAKERNFVLHEHSLSLYGFCGDCAAAIKPLSGVKKPMRRS